MVVSRLSALVLSCALLACAGALAQDAPGCLDCHEADADSPVHAVFRTAHGDLMGGGANTCTACHGRSETHDRRGRRAEPDVSFGPKWLSDVETRNAACLGCHEAGDQLLWAGSEHQQENIACNDCHQSHRPADLAGGEEASQALCLTCHTQVRAELQLPSRHPIAEGKTACVDCHNPHGGLGDGALHQVSLNDNCFACHQDKRGPFLWEHPPVAEDCALCQQCHAAAFHPSVAYGSEGLPGGGANPNLLGKNCLNCHGQVHGSNHPSGARLTR